MIEKKDLNQSDSFVEAASHLIVYQIKTSWLNIQKIGDKMSKKYDVTLSIAFVLMAIFEDEGTPVTKIAPRIGLEPNSLSRVLKTMEQKKFIKKIADKKDKRIVLIKLTKKGKEHREIALRAVFKIENNLAEGIDKNDLAAFFRVMNVINHKLSTNI
ncbi:MAG: MarR family transcriptional regulator [Chitinophagales bacterium]